MGNWSEWRTLTPQNYKNDHKGPAGYELRTVIPYAGEAHVVYVGETNNLSNRMRDHDVVRTDNLRSIIDDARRNTLFVQYRYMIRDTKGAALRLERERLGMHHDWNIKGNNAANPPRDPNPIQRMVEFGVGDVFRKDMQRANQRRRKNNK